MTARRPPRRVLQGSFIRLEPLVPTALRELAAALRRPEVFAGGWGGGPRGLPPTDEAFVAWFTATWPFSGNVYGVRIASGPDAGRLVGTTTLADFDLEAEHAHLGWTAYAPKVWGTQVNPEAKLLMLGLAFDSGFGRVKLQADERNARSREAILRLGAKYEGIARRDKLRADGSWRNSAVYSILIDEWPTVRERLNERLRLLGDEPVLLGSPSLPTGEPAR
jgi:RimJ/RimL family protein N-acetyltransferase